MIPEKYFSVDLEFMTAEVMVHVPERPRPTPFVIRRLGSNVHAGQGKRRIVMRASQWAQVLEREDRKKTKKARKRRPVPPLAATIEEVIES